MFDAFAILSPASTFKGLSGSGESNKAMTAVNAEESVHTGDHCEPSTSRQISPVFLFTMSEILYLYL
jgi:hypothetical protein